MPLLSLANLEDLRCPSCENWLNFDTEIKTIIIHNREIHLNDVPILRCDSCGMYYLSERAKSDIQRACERHDKSIAPYPIAEPNSKCTERFNFCNVEFDYDPLDYYYIPGLYRPDGSGFLTPVFFRLQVLDKFSSDPSYRFQWNVKTAGTIEMPSENLISFGINRTNKIIMWLGDIHELPDSEQHYLRSFNIASDHDICSDFYDQQIAARFADSSPEGEFIFERNRLRQMCIVKKGEDLYAHFGEISTIISNYHRPISWDNLHIKPSVDALYKIAIESLNPDFFKKQLIERLSKDKFKGLKSLKLFEMWLGLCLGLENSSTLISPLFVLYVQWTLWLGQ